MSSVLQKLYNHVCMELFLTPNRYHTKWFTRIGFSLKLKHKLETAKDKAGNSKLEMKLQLFIYSKDKDKDRRSSYDLYVT